MAKTKRTYQKSGKPRKKPRNNKNELWRWLLELLTSPIYGNVLSWSHVKPGEFTIHDPKHLAELWGRKKNKPNMCYSRMARSMRLYYGKGLLEKTTYLNYRFKIDLTAVLGYDPENSDTFILESNCCVICYGPMAMPVYHKTPCCHLCVHSACLSIRINAKQSVLCPCCGTVMSDPMDEHASTKWREDEVFAEKIATLWGNEVFFYGLSRVPSGIEVRGFWGRLRAEPDPNKNIFFGHTRQQALYNIRDYILTGTIKTIQHAFYLRSVATVTNAPTPCIIYVQENVNRL